MKIFLTGATGKVGKVLKVFLERKGYELICPQRNRFDLSQPFQLGRVLGGEGFDVLINAAAMAGIEQCEENEDLAQAVNTQSPIEMARFCQENSKRFIHFSTDYVLDGRKEGAKDESASTFPNGIYGRTKLEGEEGVLLANTDAVVARVSWVFGSETSQASGFFDSILKRAIALGDDGYLEAVADKFSSPTYVWDLAEWIEYLCRAEEVEGIWHLTHPSNRANGESWHTYAEKSIQLAYEEGIVDRMVEVRPSFQADGKIFKSLRPVHTGIQPRRLQKISEFKLRTWEEAGREFLRKQGEIC